MTDIPIIFSAPMVRALLDGRKTMTRRLAWRSARAGEPTAEGSRISYVMDDNGFSGKVTQHQRPASWQRVEAGDRLWVREAAAFIDNSQFDMPSHWQYRADTNGGDLPGDWPADEKDNPERPRWRPSIHMPRVASRLTLLVKAVKIERLQDISETDAIAEGVEPNDLDRCADNWGGVLFRRLWESLHGASAWTANPFVVATSFRVIKSNIDASEARIAA